MPVYKYSKNFSNTSKDISVMRILLLILSTIPEPKTVWKYSDRAFKINEWAGISTYERNGTEMVWWVGGYSLPCACRPTSRRPFIRPTPFFGPSPAKTVIRPTFKRHFIRPTRENFAEHKEMKEK